MRPGHRLPTVAMAAVVVLAVGCGRQGAMTPPDAPPTTAARVTVPEPPTTAGPLPAPSTTSTVTTQPTATTSESADAELESVEERRSESERTFEDWLTIVAALGPVTVPSDCDLGLDEPASLPNVPRDYRAGVHEGVDMICGERGRFAVAALPGRVVVANNSFVDPTQDERTALLAEARELGYTPRWILEMLYGRFVVIDHGLIPGAGHVTTVYAHFEEIDPTLRPGLFVDAGTRLGEIGNRGTATAAKGGTRARSIHLHWEIWIGRDFLGQGLGPEQTRAVYKALLLDGVDS